MLTPVEVLSEIHPKWREEIKLAIFEENQKSIFQEKMIVVAESIEPARISKIVLEDGAHHVVQKSSCYFRSELNAAALMISNPKSFFEHPLSSILLPDHADLENENIIPSLKISFQSINERKHIRLQIMEFTAKHGISTLIVEDILFVADELLTNVWYNAPYQVESSEVGSGVSRKTKDLCLPDDKSGTLTIGFVQDRLVISCWDPFGSVIPQRIFQRVQQSYENGVGKTITWDNKGAGIGSFMIIDRSLSYYLLCEDGVQTQICSVLSLRRSLRERMSQPKGLHWWTSKKKAA